MILQLLPLLEELELQVLLELDVKIQLPPVIVQGKPPAQTDILRPLGPGRAAEAFLHRHEQGVVGQPPSILRQESLVIRVVGDAAALVGQA